MDGSKQGAHPVMPTEMSSELQEELDRLRADRERLQRQLEERSRELAAHAHGLALSEARFRDVIEHNADAIIVVASDGVIRFVNGMAARLFDTDREKLVG